MACNGRTGAGLGSCLYLHHRTQVSACLFRVSLVARTLQASPLG